MYNVKCNLHSNCKENSDKIYRKGNEKSEKKNISL